MTLLPEGGAALPVSVTTTRKVQGGAAIPVYGYMTAPTDGRPALGGPAVPVRVLTAADLKVNGGQWTLEGRPYAMPVYTAPAGVKVMGGPALAVYPINAWPTVPVVPAWAPIDVAGLALWLKADAGLFKDAAKAQPCTADADAIYTWADQSGNGRDAIQAMLAARPTYKVNIQNGKAGVLADGVDDYLQTAFALAQPQTFYYVIRVVSFIANAEDFDGVGVNYRTIYNQTVADRHVLYAGTNFQPLGTLTDGTTGIITAVFNGASSTIRINNGGTATGNPGVANGGGVTLFSSPVPNAFANNYIFEFLEYGGTVAAGDDANIISYLNTRWAVY